MIVQTVQISCMTDKAEIVQMMPATTSLAPKITEFCVAIRTTRFCSQPSNAFQTKPQ